MTVTRAVLVMVELLPGCKLLDGLRRYGALVAARDGETTRAALLRADARGEEQGEGGEGGREAAPALVARRRRDAEARCVWCVVMLCDEARSRPDPTDPQARRSRSSRRRCAPRSTGRACRLGSYALKSNAMLSLNRERASERAWSELRSARASSPLGSVRTAVAAAATPPPSASQRCPSTEPLPSRRTIVRRLAAPREVRRPDGAPD